MYAPNSDYNSNKVPLLPLDKELEVKSTSQTYNESSIGLDILKEPDNLIELYNLDDEEEMFRDGSGGTTKKTPEEIYLWHVQQFSKKNLQKEIIHLRDYNLQPLEGRDIEEITLEEMQELVNNTNAEGLQSGIYPDFDENQDPDFKLGKFDQIFNFFVKIV